MFWLLLQRGFNFSTFEKSGRCKRWQRMSLVMDQVFIMGYDSQDNVLVGEFKKNELRN